MLAIAGTWSSDPAFAGVVAVAGSAAAARACRRRLSRHGAPRIQRGHRDGAARALLGREQPAAFAFTNDSIARRHARIRNRRRPQVSRRFRTHAMRHRAARRRGTRSRVTLLPVRLGAQIVARDSRAPAGPIRPRVVARARSRLRARSSSRRIRCARRAAGPAARATGMRPRRTVGAGSELHQLRAYVQGDPLARIDWKATARTRRLITREFSEDQHLDVLVAIDAGRLSRVRAGRLDRFGLYANVAARMAEVVTPNDDRIGLVVFSDRTLAVCAPERGMSAIMRIRRTLERLTRSRRGIRSRRRGGAHPRAAETSHADRDCSRTSTMRLSRSSWRAPCGCCRRRISSSSPAFTARRLPIACAHARRASGATRGSRWRRRSTRRAPPRNDAAAPAGRARHRDARRACSSKPCSTNTNRCGVRAAI